MNANYLLSVLDLYLLKENNGKLIIEIDNNENLVKVNFSYSFDHTNRTFVKISKPEFFDTFEAIIAKIQGNSKVLDIETLDDNNKKMYTYSFQKGRKIVFINFSDAEMSLIKSRIAGVDDDLILTLEDVTKEETYNEIYQENQEKNTKFAFSFGFANYMTLFLTTIWILDVFMIALWIFKAFIK